MPRGILPLTNEQLDAMDGSWIKRDEKKLERVARVRRAIKAAYYEGCDLDSDLLANAALSAINHND